MVVPQQTKSEIIHTKLSNPITKTFADCFRLRKVEERILQNAKMYHILKLTIETIIDFHNFLQTIALNLTVLYNSLQTTILTRTVRYHCQQTIILNCSVS